MGYPTHEITVHDIADTQAALEALFPQPGVYIVNVVQKPRLEEGRSKGIICAAPLGMFSELAVAALRRGE